MSFRVLIFTTRKADITPAAFKEHLEKTHIPLQKKLLGDKFPQSHTRRYIGRTKEGDKFPAVVLLGDQSQFNYDVISELVFPDEATFQAFFATYQAQYAEIAADEANFVSSLTAVALNDTIEG